jgi:predicted TIM-barrel fold metal-dependent hydrolase
MHSFPILDVHQHLICPGESRYAWTDSLPALAGKTFGIAEYVAAAAGTGITQALFMETAPDDWAAENGWVTPHVGRAGSPTVGIVSNGRPESDAFPAWLDRCRANPAIVGFRRICHPEPDELSQSATFRENVRRIGRAGLTFDLCFLPRQLLVARELAMACPDVRCILDHCGIPNIADGQLDPWRADLARLAELPNVWCKLSGLLAYCRPDRATLDAVRPFAQLAIATFGPRRMVWGSDWPVVNLTSDLRTWVDVTRQLLTGHSEAEQRAMLFDNAVEVYGLDRRAVSPFSDGPEGRASTIS